MSGLLRIRHTMHIVCPSPLKRWSNNRQKKPRPKKDGTTPSKDPSPPPLPIDSPNGGTTISSTKSNSIPTTNSLNNNVLPYLRPENAVFTRSLAECNIHELIRQPNGVDKNEWIANNIVAFFNHVNALYNAMCVYCTPTSCPTMTGPQNSTYLWIDERNKKVKKSAPEYIDLSMMYIQKTLSDDTIFPTRLDQQFPIYFDSHVRKMVRLLFQAVAHLYAAHFCQIIDSQLHPHLNSLFLHFISFLIRSNIISADCSNGNLPSQAQSTTPGQTDAREFRAEIESLEALYQLLADQWRHAYAQACAMKKKQQTTNENL